MEKLRKALTRDWEYKNSSTCIEVFENIQIQDENCGLQVEVENKYREKKKNISIYMYIPTRKWNGKTVFECDIKNLNLWTYLSRFFNWKDSEMKFYGCLYFDYLPALIHKRITVKIKIKKKKKK